MDPFLPFINSIITLPDFELYLKLLQQYRPTYPLSYIQMYENQFSEEIKNAMTENNINIRMFPGVGAGTYGSIHNISTNARWPNTVVKNQRNDPMNPKSNSMMTFFKEFLIHHTVSSIMPTITPEIRYLKKKTEITGINRRFGMAKMNRRQYIHFDQYLSLLDRPGLDQEHKQFYLLKKLFGISSVLNNLQNQCGFIHNDFKENNMFVNHLNIEGNTLDDNDIKIIDFTFSSVDYNLNGRRFFIPVTLGMIGDADMIYGSNTLEDQNNYCKSSDMLFFMTSLRARYDHLLRSILDNLYDPFFDTLFKYTYDGVDYSLLECIDDYERNYPTELFTPFNVSKNIGHFINHIIYISNNNGKNLSQDEIKHITDNVIRNFNPEKFRNIIFNFLNNYLRHHPFVLASIQATYAAYAAAVAAAVAAAPPAAVAPAAGTPRRSPPAAAPRRSPPAAAPRRSPPAAAPRRSPPAASGSANSAARSSSNSQGRKKRARPSSP